MTYAILKAWVREFQAKTLKVDSVHTSGDNIRIHFNQARDLMLIAGNREGIPFWNCDGESPEREEPIWNQLIHATLTEIRIADNDRVIFFEFAQTDIYQQNTKYVVIGEFTPPKPNIILAIQQDELIIVDAIRKYSYADNPQRQILPRLPYIQAKTSFSAVEQIVVLPLTIEPAGKETIICNSINDYLANYYRYIVLGGADLQRQKSIRLHWEKELKKAKQKLLKQQTELVVAENSNHWHICAETLKYNLHNIQKGQTVLTATNYFDPLLGNVDIDLLPDKSPQQNLQLYLKKYMKAKRGGEIIRQNITETEQNTKHLENILQRVDSGEFVDFQQSRNLAGLGKKLDLADKLLKLRLNEDFEIVIGRKAKENDFITTQLGRAHDWWFHTRIYHGSHILLRCFRKTAPDETLINACCSLAAWYSKARFSLNVPVDYTQIRFVRKPRKSAPGLVTYTNHQSVFANPKDLRTVREELLK